MSADPERTAHPMDAAIDSNRMATTAGVIDLGSPAAEGALVDTVNRAADRAIEAVDVSCWFGKRKVLETVSLDIPKSTVVALIGPSGCGKSTFLRTLNRMHELIPGASVGGAVRLGGVDIYGPTMRAAEIRTRIGMVFQKPNPFPSMSIAENVLAGLKLTGKKAKDSNELVEWALTRASLWNEVKDRLSSPGGSLSGGQQQRLCIARSLAVKP